MKLSRTDKQTLMKIYIGDFYEKISSHVIIPTFLKKESEAYEITILYVCLSPLITFEPVGRFL
jgi:hypothetical protein